jgi:phosphoribosylglycinamide formyltransferase-1
VVSNVAGVEGLARAARAGIAARAVPHIDHSSRESFDSAVDAALNEAGVEFVCLAGFMRVLSGGFVDRWRGRLVNIHPSLLPAFKGLNVHARVLASGVRISGCTVHYVVPELDSGPIIAQAAVPVLPDDDEDSLALRTLAAEHRLYPLALRLMAEGGVELDGGRAVYAGARVASGEMFCPPLPEAAP